MAESVDELDPTLRGILELHMQRMADIQQRAYEDSKAIAEESIKTYKRYSGVRSAVLDKALNTLGITQQT